VRFLIGMWLDDNWEEDLPADLQEAGLDAGACEEVRDAPVSFEQLCEAQDGCDVLGKLDQLYEQAQEAGNPKVLHVIDAARRQELRARAGRTQEDARVAGIITRDRREREMRKSVQVIANARNKAVLDAVRDEKAKLDLARKRSVELKRKAAAIFEATLEEQARTQVALCLDATMFDGSAKKEKQHRWQAFERIALLPPSVEPRHRFNLERDWTHWDVYERSRQPSSAAYAAQYMKRMKTLLQWRTDGLHVRFNAWWAKALLSSVSISLTLVCCVVAPAVMQ
jgi:hypothetical protein